MRLILDDKVGIYEILYWKECKSQEKIEFFLFAYRTYPSIVQSGFILSAFIIIKFV